MTTDTTDVGDATYVLRKTPSREIELDFPEPEQNASAAPPQSPERAPYLYEDTRAPEDEEEETSMCYSCIQDGRFTTLDMLFIFGGMLMYVADLATDLLVAVQYFREDRILYSILTFVFVLFPSLVLQYFSLRWFVSDLDEDQEHKKKGVLARIWSWVQWLAMHFLQLGAIKRYWRTLKYGLKSRKDHRYYKLMVYEYRDITMLRLLEAFMESAPQLVLQVYIMVETQNLYWFSAASAIVSLGSLSWGLEAYHKALRESRADKKNISFLGVGMRMVWRLLTITARVLAMALFAAIYEWWIFVVAGLHWLLMTVWLIWQETDFCETKFEERLFDAVMGVIHIFCFFNMKEGRTRYRAAIFYTIIFAENTVMFALWYREQESRNQMYGLPALVFVWGGFFLGIFIMSFYYRLCHPRGVLPFCICGESDGEGANDNEDENTKKDAEFVNAGTDEVDFGSPSEGRLSNGVECDGVPHVGASRLATKPKFADVVDEVDRTTSTSKGGRRSEYYVNLFAYRSRRQIHEHLLATPTSHSRGNSVVTTPPQSATDVAPHIVDSCAVYADGRVFMNAHNV